MLRSKYAQFDEATLAAVRENVDEINAHLTSNAAGRYRRLQATIAWLKTDPELGSQMVELLNVCPFNPTPRSEAVSALAAQVAELKAELAARKKLEATEKARDEIRAAHKEMTAYKKGLTTKKDK